MDKWLYLAGGGVVGTFCRYAVSAAALQKMGPDFPYGTLIVNLTGCFLIGFLDALSESKFALPANIRIMAIAGFCGAYTTFSAFMIETLNLMKAGEVLRAISYVVISVVLGLAVCRLGILLGENI